MGGKRLPFHRDLPGGNSKPCGCIVHYCGIPRSNCLPIFCDIHGLHDLRSKVRSQAILFWTRGSFLRTERYLFSHSNFILGDWWRTLFHRFSIRFLDSTSFLLLTLTEICDVLAPDIESIETAITLSSRTMHAVSPLLMPANSVAKISGKSML